MPSRSLRSILDSLSEVALQLPDDIESFFELKLDDSLEACLEAIVDVGASAKIRTGGVSADAFPSVQDGRSLRDHVPSPHGCPSRRLPGCTIRCAVHSVSDLRRRCASGVDARFSQPGARSVAGVVGQAGRS